MICPQSDLLKTLGQADTVLVSTSAKAMIGRFAASLPDAASGHILECRLAKPGDACDYSVALSRGDKGFARFRQFLGEGPFWDTARTVLDAAQNKLPDAGLLWLEFDFSENGPAAPCFFVSQGAQTAEPADTFALAIGLADVLALPVEDSLRLFAAQLPASVRLKQAGIMAGRGAGAMRMVLDGVPSSEVTPFIKQIGWPGNMASAAHLQGIVERISLSGTCRVDLDLAATLGSGLGIEVLYPDLGEPREVAGVLHDEGLCGDETAAALENLMPRRTLERGAGTRLDFGLNHLKLSVRPRTHTVEAKAYFSLLNLPDFPQGSV